MFQSIALALVLVTAQSVAQLPKDANANAALQLQATETQAAAAAAAATPFGSKQLTRCRQSCYQQVSPAQATKDKTHLMDTCMCSLYGTLDCSERLSSATSRLASQRQRQQPKRSPVCPVGQWQWAWQTAQAKGRAAQGRTGQGKRRRENVLFTLYVNVSRSLLVHLLYLTLS